MNHQKLNNKLTMICTNKLLMFVLSAQLHVDITLLALQTQSMIPQKIYNSQEFLLLL